MDYEFLKENKIKIIKKLNKLGWEYIEDEFTYSCFGHRREHFQRLDIMEFEDGDNIATLNYVLIFHYLNRSLNREDNCTIQTYEVTGTYETIIGRYKKDFYGCYGTNGSPSLNAEEMDLFTKLMKLIDKYNKEDQDEI